MLLSIPMAKILYLPPMKPVSDQKVVTAKGDSALHFAVSVLRALGDVPEENIQFFYTLHTEGFLKAIQMN